MHTFLLGVDEAGRGPLAGPVAVGVVAVPHDFDIQEAFPGVTDSKKLSEKKREELYEIARTLQQAGALDFCVRFASHAVIDTIGITKAVREGVFDGVRFLAPEPQGTHVLLDGLLAAPPEYSQQTIIKGDLTQPVISLASILAKVSRDRLMCALAQEYPMYEFEVHKGYGTKRHRELIAQFGISDVHRKTYCHI